MIYKIKVKERSYFFYIIGVNSYRGIVLVVLCKNKNNVVLVKDFFCKIRINFYLFL